VKEGLELAIQIGCNRVIAEYDSSETIDTRKGDQVWHNESTVIFPDCIDKALVIGSVFFNHRLREANSLAHSLAKKCFLIKYSSFGVDEPPRFLLDNLLTVICVAHQ
jgi:hypothetical protein